MLKLDNDCIFSELTNMIWYKNYTPHKLNFNLALTRLAVSADRAICHSHLFLFPLTAQKITKDEEKWPGIQEKRLAKKRKKIMYLLTATSFIAFMLPKFLYVVLYMFSGACDVKTYNFRKYIADVRGSCNCKFLPDNGVNF